MATRRSAQAPRAHRHKTEHEQLAIAREHAIDLAQERIRVDLELERVRQQYRIDRVALNRQLREPRSKLGARIVDSRDQSLRTSTGVA